MLAQVAAKHKKIMQNFTEICWEESTAPPSPTPPCLQGIDIPAPASPSNLWEYFQAIDSTGLSDSSTAESFDASPNDPKPSSKNSRCRKRRRDRDAVAPQLPTELDKNQAWGSASSLSDVSASQNPKQLSKDQRYRKRRKEKELSKEEEIASLKREIDMLRKENSSLKICLQLSILN